jgi:AcrR family transcriptional regulator
MSEVGFSELTIEAIAARAEVGKPTIYRRWSSKAHLVMEAFLAATNPELTFPNTGSVGGYSPPNAAIGK